MSISNILNGHRFLKHVVSASRKRKDEKVIRGILVALTRISTKNDYIVSINLSRMSHPWLKTLPHLFRIKAWLNFNSRFDFFPCIHMNIIKPDIIQSFVISFFFRGSNLYLIWVLRFIDFVFLYLHQRPCFKRINGCFSSNQHQPSVVEKIHGVTCSLNRNTVWVNFNLFPFQLEDFIVEPPVADKGLCALLLDGNSVEIIM